MTTMNGTTTPTTPTISDKEKARRERCHARYVAAQRSVDTLLAATLAASQSVRDSITDALDAKGLKGKARTSERAALLRADKAALMSSVALDAANVTISPRGKLGIVGMATAQRNGRDVALVAVNGTLRETVTVNVDALITLVETLRSK